MGELESELCKQVTENKITLPYKFYVYEAGKHV